MLAIGLLGVVLSGCGGDADEAPVQTAPSPAAPVETGSAAIAPMAPAEPIAAPPPGTAAPAAISSAPDGPAESAPMDASAQEKILAAMQSYVIDNSASPKSLEELVAKRYLKSIPPAPEGKKWVYNPESLGIELADK